MPAVPHYPGDEPEERHLPDVGELVDEILRGGDDPRPNPGAA